MRRNAIVQIGLVLIIFRLAGLALRFLVQSGGGPAARLSLFGAAAMQHGGVLLLVVAALLALSGVSRTLRGPLALLLCLGAPLLMIAGETDLVYGYITGEPLTPTTFRTYRGPQLFHSKEFIEPVRAHALPIAVAATAILAITAWTVIAAWRWWRRRDGHAPAWMAAGTLAAAGAALMALPLLLATKAPPPVEISFAREYLGLDGIRLRGGERQAIASLRAAVGLPAGHVWLDDRFPLVHGPAGSGGPGGAGIESRERRPDLIVVVIESLRAPSLGFLQPGAPSNTPALDELAKQSVVFPRYISNGFPSAPSVFSLHCSAWPHRSKEILTDFTGTRFDSLPARLRDLGYHTLFIGASAAFDHSDVWLGRWYAQVEELINRGLRRSDKVIVDETVKLIEEHDRRAPGEPLFAFITTTTTHYPYRNPTDDPETKQLPEDAPLSEKYDNTLRYADRQLGRLFRFLEGRPRRDDTVVVVVGDHSFYLDLATTSGLPENDNEWTAALIHGPAALVGVPRRIDRATSHVDVMPTLLALAGDRRPTAALGSDLLGPPRAGPGSAVAVRSGGIRLDTEGWRLVFDRRSPGAPRIEPAFPELRLPLPPAAGLFADDEIHRLEDRVDAWSYLIEHDRVWDPALLRR